MYICIYIYIYIHTHAYIHMCTYHNPDILQVRTPRRWLEHEKWGLLARMYVYQFVYVCMYVCMYIYIYIYIYIYWYTLFIYTYTYIHTVNIYIHILCRHIHANGAWTVGLLVCVHMYKFLYVCTHEFFTRIVCICICVCRRGMNHTCVYVYL